jgi:hypothetical protein
MRNQWEHRPNRCFGHRFVAPTRLEKGDFGFLTCLDGSEPGQEATDSSSFGVIFPYENDGINKASRHRILGIKVNGVTSASLRGLTELTRNTMIFSPRLLSMDSRHTE